MVCCVAIGIKDGNLKYPMQVKIGGSSQPIRCQMPGNKVIVTLQAPLHRTSIAEDIGRVTQSPEEHTNNGT